MSEFYACVQPPRCLSEANWWTAVGVFAAPEGKVHVGTAVPAGDTTAADPAEVVWRLTIRGATLEPAYVLRDGRFEELGDAAEWRRRPGVANALEAARMQWRWGRRW